MKRNIDIQKEWEAIGAKFDSQIALPSFRIPDHYFDTLPETMLAIVSAQDANPSFPVTPNPYTVPSGYFESLPAQILQQAKDFDTAVNHTHIEGLSKRTPYMEPGQQYFDQLASTLLAKISGEEVPEEELHDAPLLSALKHSNPYQTPEIHIDLTQILPAAREEKTPAKSIPMVTARKRMNLSQWSAAASVALFFVLGAVWLQMGKMNGTPAMSAVSENINTKANKLLASIPDKDLEQYVQQHADEFDEFTLEASLASVPAETQTKNLESALNDISDEDIKAYLNTY